VAHQAATRRLVADAMVTCPKTHDPQTSVDQIRALFDDDHVRMALVVATNGRLVTTIERSDLVAAESDFRQAAQLGTLVDRTVAPSDALYGATALLLRKGRRRLAVVDDAGRLLGLLRLKRDRTGFCSDAGIRRRAAERHRLSCRPACPARPVAARPG
jgi:CBS-domain-containing membrane protein